MSASSRSLHPMHAQLPTRQYLAEMWDRRDFAVAFPVEQLRSSHQTTLLGNLWHLANPMLSVAVYYVIFGLLLKTSRGIDNYVLFLMVGVFSFGLTSRTVLGGARAISDNAGLMRAIRFPRALLPISLVISNLLTFVFELIILAVVAVLTGEGISSRWLALPVIVLIQSVLNLGGAFVAARLNDSFRDVQQIIPFLFRLLMYASGVMFDIRAYAETGPAWVQTFVRWNPMVEVVELYRWVFLGSAVDGGGLLRLVVVASVLLVVGFRFFRAAELRYGRA